MLLCWINTVGLMRGQGLLLIGLLVAGLVFYPLTAISRKAGAPGSRTGAPITSAFNELTCGSTSECHVNSDGGPGQVFIEARDGDRAGGEDLDLYPGDERVTLELTVVD